LAAAVAVESGLGYSVVNAAFPFPPKNIINATIHKMEAASLNASTPHQPCLTTLDHFIKPIKE
jgi:hypothetical protein